MADSGYRVETISGMRVVVAPAAVDVTTTDELRRILLDSAAEGHATVVVDMTRTRICHFLGFSVLVRAHRRALSGGGGLRLAVPADGPLVRGLDLTGVGRFIPTFIGLDEALAELPRRDHAVAPADLLELRDHACRPGSPAEGAWGGG